MVVLCNNNNIGDEEEEVSSVEFNHMARTKALLEFAINYLYGETFLIEKLTALRLAKTDEGVEKMYRLRFPDTPLNMMKESIRVYQTTTLSKECERIGTDAMKSFKHAVLDLSCIHKSDVKNLGNIILKAATNLHTIYAASKSIHYLIPRFASTDEDFKNLRTQLYLYCLSNEFYTTASGYIDLVNDVGNIKI
jgi:hypothetical protein